MAHQTKSQWNAVESLTPAYEDVYSRPDPSLIGFDHGDSPLAIMLANDDRPDLAARDYQQGTEGNAVPRSSLATILSKDRLSESDITSLMGCMNDLGLPSSWCSNPRLYHILHRTDRLDLLSKILDAHLSDLWLPLPKRLVRRWLNDAETKEFLRTQEMVLHDDIPVDLEGLHFALESVDELRLFRVKHLGAGGFGDVHHVRNQQNGQAYACKTMARPVRYEAHVELMRSFRREIMGMRRVCHRHCVELVASCTDMDSLTILSCPVADMDLSNFLNMDLDSSQLETLRYTIGCITSALAYLHSLKIRSESTHSPQCSGTNPS